MVASDRPSAFHSGTAPLMENSNQEALSVSAPASAACKCCGSLAPLFGVVDFHKNCEIAHGRNVLSLSGVPVYYHRCRSCGFIFTVAFDHFSPGDFAREIYNDEYRLVDPDFAD